MLLAKLGRENVVILLKKQEKMERPSDITGLIYVPFTENIAKEAGVSLANAMDVGGYKIRYRQALRPDRPLHPHPMLGAVRARAASELMRTAPFFG